LQCVGFGKQVEAAHHFGKKRELQTLSRFYPSMETRLIVAYILIAGLVAALVAAGIMIRRKRERDRQMKRGRRTTPR
jgi:hypothetical protein